MKKFWAMSALLMACAGETTVDSEDSDPGNIRDDMARKLRLDGGSVVADGGILPSDAGGSRSDAGTLVDAGVGLPDAGRDTGVGTPDASADAARVLDASVTYPRDGTWRVTLSTTSVTGNWQCGNPGTVTELWTFTGGAMLNSADLNATGGADFYTQEFANGVLTLEVYLTGTVLHGTYTLAIHDETGAHSCEFVRNIMGVLAL